MVFMASLSLSGKRLYGEERLPVPITRNLLFDFKNASDHTSVSSFTIPKRVGGEFLHTFPPPASLNCREIPPPVPSKYAKDAHFSR
jgi:hypothetical protein